MLVPAYRAYRAQRQRITLFFTDPMSASPLVLVSNRLGFPFILDSITLVSQANVIIDIWAQFFIADDNDATATFTPSGSPVIYWQGPHVPGEPDWPHLISSNPVTIEPHRLEPQAGKFLKCALATTGFTLDHTAAVELIIL